MASKTATSKKLVLTTEQLLSHPNLCAVDGKLYDLEAFAKVHPGGAHILSAGAYDATALFRSMHPGKDPEKSEVFQKHCVGTYKRNEATEPNYTFDSPFAKDLIATVRKAMGNTSWYAPTGFWARTFLIMALTLYTEYYWITTGTLLSGILVGVMHSQIGLSIQHDGSHGAISKDPKVNAFFAYGADWIGNSRWIWLQQHILWHHPHTNHQDLDPDASSAEPFIVFNDYTKNGTMKEKVKPATSYQDYLVYAVLGMYGPSVIYNPYVYTMKHSDRIPESVSTGEFFTKQKPLAVALRAFYFFRIVVAPWYLNNTNLFMAFFLVNFVTGVFLTGLFVVSHNFEGSDRDPLDLKGKNASNKPVCWYKAQAETSCTYGGTIGMLLTGGLNLQIEHHLFPRISSWHYPYLQDAVRECCKRHGVTYKYYPTLYENTVSMLRYMRKVGVLAVLAHAE
eukprot:g752.t1